MFFWRATLVVLVVSACRQPAPAPGTSPTLGRARRGPSVEATVITIQTALQPANRTTAHTVVIADSKARSTDEAERWRLYDLDERTVTFVDDIAGTYRTERIDSVFAQRRAALRRPVDRELPAAQFETTATQQQILNLPATQSLIRLGGYQRELWFADHPLIPDDLFAIMHGTAEPSTRLGAIVAAADQGLIAARGFPLLDRAELPYGKTKMVVERRVTAVQQRQVSASMIEIPEGYEEITVPDANRQPVSSRPPDRTAPAAGSPPSATDRTAP